MVGVEVRNGLLWWWSKSDPDPVIEQIEMKSMADEVINEVRNGGHINLGPSIHRQLVEEMGGSQAWEALKADLDTAQEEFKW